MHIRIRALLRAFAFACLILIEGACSSPQDDKSELQYGLTLVPSGIDPHLNASAELGIPLRSVYDTLVFQEAGTGRFLPGLAKNWKLSNDGLTYTFQLRQDVIFHDGARFDAQAVKANIDYITDPDHHSQKAIFMLGPLERVELLDTWTVAFHLSEPFAPFLDSLSQVYLGMASPDALERWGPTDYQFHQVGSGPYRFVEYIPNDRLVLERNPDYAWGPGVYESEAGQIERIVFRFYVDAASRAFALESNQIDVFGEVPPRDAERLGAKPDFELYPVPIPGQPLQFFFNLQRAPTDDLRVRRGLLLALDRARIVETIFGRSSPVAQAPLSAGTFGMASDDVFTTFDPEQSRALLEEAGWMLDSEGYRQKDGARLSLKIVAPDWGSNPEVAQLMQAAWSDIGVESELEVAPNFGILKETQSDGDYHLIGLNFFGSDPDLLRPFYTTGGLYNWSGVQDADIDGLLEEAARISSDRQARIELYQRFFDRAREQVLLVPIRDYVNLVVAHSKVQGLQFNAQGWFPNLIDLHLAR
jgi:peptide/nickel transport system substrate-binding protein